MNIERKRKNECLAADCGFTKDRCLVNYGRNCIKQGGTKIPVQSATHKDAVRVGAQTNGMKIYWITDGWSMEDWGE